MQFQSQRPGLFRRTPPAVFPPIFGLFGLGLAWRRATEQFPVSSAVGDFILGATSILFLFAFVAYGAKFIMRPGVLGDDLKILPGRAGLAGMTLGGMLFAAALIPFSIPLAKAVLLVSVGVHTIIVAMVLRALLSGPSEARAVTPVWHLLFVGFIISPVAAVPLGYVSWSQGVLWFTLAFAVFIWAMSAAQMLQKEMPAPLRPTLAIHLSPAALLGTVSYLLGYPSLGYAFGILSILILTALVLRLRWITAAGFSPFWGAFTFPLAAFSTLMQIMGAIGEGEAFQILGGITLVAASLIIPYITYRIMKLWAKGELAVKTNAAQA